MLPGFSTLADSLPVAAIPAELDESKQSALSQLVADPTANWIFVMEAYAPLIDSAPTTTGLFPPPLMDEALMDVGADGVVDDGVLYAADRAVHTLPTESPPNKTFQPRLQSALNFTARIPEPGGTSPRGSSSYGAIEVLNADGGIDDWMWRSWDGRTVNIYAGGILYPGRAAQTILDWAEYQLVLQAIATDVKRDDRKYTISIRDNSQLFNLPLQTSAYGGTGTSDGDDNVTGQLRPLGFGKVINCAPPNIDSTNFVYQLHDGRISSVDEVRVAGDATVFTFDSDVADVWAWTPVAGKYCTDITNGYIRFYSAPSGQVTVDFSGDKTGGTYVSTPSTIVRRIASLKGGLTDPDDINTDSFTDIADTETIGLYFKDQKTIADAISMALSSIDGYWYFDRSAKLTVGRFTNPDDAIPETTIDSNRIVRGSIRTEFADRPVWRYRISYDQLYHVQDGDSLASGLSASDRAYYSTPYRVSSSEDTHVRDVAHLYSQDIERVTYLTETAEAAAEAARLLARDKVQRYITQANVKEGLFEFYPGQVISMQLNDGYRNMIILQVDEDSHDRDVRLRCWG